VLRIAVLVSGGGTNLEALFAAQDKGILKSGKITLVVSDREGAYALERARKRNVKSAIIKKGEGFDAALDKVLFENDIDLIVLAGFLSILSDDFVRKYDKKIINIHPSLIPSFCGKGHYGLRVHEAALARGVKLTGATVHFVNDDVDGGEIIMQKAVEVKEEDTPETLQRRVMEEAEWVILPLSVEEICRERIEK
jgi:phosphoribosylglycinamide formyltransferase-1